MSNFMKFLLLGAELFHVNGQTDTYTHTHTHTHTGMTKLIVAMIHPPEFVR